MNWVLRIVAFVCVFVAGGLIGKGVADTGYDYLCGQCHLAAKRREVEAEGNQEERLRGAIIGPARIELLKQQLVAAIEERNRARSWVVRMVEGGYHNLDIAYQRVEDNLLEWNS